MIKDIVLLTTNFYKEENMSIYSLLKETGYFEFHNQINKSDIYECLILYPDSIIQWLDWSENKRSSSGWYFTMETDTQYIVGYFPSNKDLKPVKYSDKNEACTNFILREIEDIRLKG